MDIQAQLETLSAFARTLPFRVQDEFSRKELDIVYGVENIAATYGFALRETGNLCEGTTNVLVGKETAANLVSFIQKDERIEEDNRAKIPELAYEIQQKIFDPVLPILKQAGFPIKDGKVAAPISQPKITTGVLRAAQEASGFQVQGSGKTAATPTSAELNAKRYPLNASSPPLEERNLRALLRISAGTNYSEPKLREAFEDLPPGLRQALSSVDTANAVQAVAKKHFLHVDQMASLASETGLVLLGLTHPADFVANLGKRMRMNEDEAREIARDISADIFVKVRELLKGLHEEKGPAPSPQTSAELEAKSYKLKASLNTPYAPSAKWNTGENVLARQAGPKEEPGGTAPAQRGPLSREEVLRGIENPRTIQQPNSDSSLTAKSYKLKADLVGPTGWKSSQEAFSGERLAVSEKKENSAPIPPKPTIPPTPLMPPPLGIKTRPRDGGDAPLPEKPAAEPRDFLEEKLQRPVALPKVERRYTSDPYREPLE